MHQVNMPKRQTLSYVSNCSTGNDHIAKQYTQSKKVQWLKKKMMLAQLQEVRIQLSKEQLAILAEIGERVHSGPGAFTMITNALFKSNGIDLYDLDCDEVLTTQVNFIADLSSCDSEVLSEEIILEKQNKELENIIRKMYRSTQAMHMLMKQQVFYDDTHKQALGYQNLFHLKKAQLIKPTLYDGGVIAKEHAVIFMIDDEETLILEEQSRSKMLDIQNDPILVKQKINISLNDYSKLNNLKEDFDKRFVTQQELSAEQAFWLKHSNYNLNTSVKSHTPVRIEAPSELLKVSLVNESLKKLKYHLASFDKVVKKRTTSDVITAGAWGFDHTKACFVTEIIPFLKVLKDTFNAFDKTLLDEITEVQTVLTK
nr:hypothetical protein [Tanacetum cinerariifolium]